jgi:magnesium transporter
MFRKRSMSRYAKWYRYKTMRITGAQKGAVMDKKPTILDDIREHLDTVIQLDSTLGIYLWEEFIKLHPADMARFLTDVDPEAFSKLFPRLSAPTQLAIFEEFSLPLKVEALETLDEQAKVNALNRLPADELTDLFELLSDEDLKKYLDLLHKKAREKVLSLMQFHPESAGGIMDAEVLTLQGDFTVEKSISILQRLRPNQDIYQQIYVTNREHQLIGYIKLEDLVLNQPKIRIADFMRKPELVVQAEEDREAIAKQMVHYGLLSVPVVDPEDHLLGVIPGSTLVDVLVEEAGEDVQKISAVTPLKYPYFETSFLRIAFERGYILMLLLIAQSLSIMIYRNYESTMVGVLLIFATMLTSTGGNASSQTSAVVIQGMANGDINQATISRFIRRELMIAATLAIVLGITAFFRGYMETKNLSASLVISIAAGLIVMVAMTIGSCVPLVLKRLNIDPAFAAGPFLATIMDIIGIFIYCNVARMIL